MSMLLKNGMTINLITGQVFLAQNMGEAATGDKTDTTTGAATTEGETTQGQTTGEDDTGTEGGTTEPAESTDGTAEGETAGTTDGTEGTDTTEGEAGDGTATDGQSEDTTGGEGVITEDGSGMTMGGMESGMMDGMYPGMDGGDGTQAKDPLLSNWFFVGGISAGTLVVGIVLGILLAKKRIKKGIELYED